MRGKRLNLEDWCVRHGPREFFEGANDVGDRNAGRKEAEGNSEAVSLIEEELDCTGPPTGSGAKGEASKACD
eukprot:1084871-Pleurochrysis_carterae.AAC.3